jgi:diadenosine tetraphosphatase ApaH/serine/threonine PP2A family protein phosphatase
MSEEKKTAEKHIYVNKRPGELGPSDRNKMREQEVALEFIKKLLQPKTFINYSDSFSSFCMPPEKIIELCKYTQDVLQSQKMVLNLRSPAKIFGDIHGQYSDLMRFFDLWGVPCEGETDKDIETFDYVFLGDYVDRGSYSLETICLMFALKIRYPDQIHLLRGNHEDEWINMTFGFADECANRLNEDIDHPRSVFKCINGIFQYLPLAAIIDNKVICLHGGIGESLKHISQIEALERPLEVVHEVTNDEQQLIVDVLWSDPTDSDQEMGIYANTIRDPQGTGNIVKFGPDRVHKFLNDNNLSMIIRAHECVMDGFERFAGGSLITVFSATDYCGKHKNAGAVLILGKNAEITPKLIYPSTVMSNNWMDDEEALKKRPPTPPRWKSGIAVQKNM